MTTSGRSGKLDHGGPSALTLLIGELRRVVVELRFSHGVHLFKARAIDFASRIERHFSQKYDLFRRFVTDASEGRLTLSLVSG